MSIKFNANNFNKMSKAWKINTPEIQEHLKEFDHDNVSYRDIALLEQLVTNANKHKQRVCAKNQNMDERMIYGLRYTVYEVFSAQKVFEFPTNEEDLAFYSGRFDSLIIQETQDFTLFYA